MMRIILILLLLSITTTLSANPFASKMNRRKSAPLQKIRTNLLYVGYALMENESFAIIQVEKSQYLLKEGETVGRIKIVRFSSNSLVYKENDRLFLVEINPLDN